jgi:hypothetical protein
MKRKSGVWPVFGKAVHAGMAQAFRLAGCEPYHYFIKLAGFIFLPNAGYAFIPARCWVGARLCPFLLCLAAQPTKGY